MVEHVSVYLTGEKAKFQCLDPHLEETKQCRCFFGWVQDFSKIFMHILNPEVKNMKQGCIGFGRPSFGSRGTTGVNSVRSCQKLPMPYRSNPSWPQDGCAAGQGWASLEIVLMPL